jgi:hypothetical protein
MKRLSIVLVAALAATLATTALRAEEKSSHEDLRRSLKDLDLVGSWIYDDIDAGFAEARKSGKPLLVVFR